jgi:hypothetical protein
VYYYPQALELRAYWNVEQDWNIYSTAIDLQKPNAIKKNKPKEEKKDKKEDEEHANDPYGYGSGNGYGNTPGGYGSSGGYGSNPSFPARR